MTDRKSCFVVVAWLVAACTTGPGAGTASAKPTADDQADAPRVHNPAVPTGAPKTLAVRRTWRFGGEDAEDPDEVLFGAIVEVLAGENGTAYALDMQLNQIEVIDAAGNLTRTLGRAGDGPGEFRMPIGMCRMPDDRLAVLQAMPPRIVTFDASGEPLADLPMPVTGMGSAVLQIRSGGGIVAGLAQETGFSEGSVKIARKLIVLAGDAGTGPTLWETANEINPSAMVIGGHESNEMPAWDITPDGKVIVSGAYDAYRVDVYSAAGRLERSFDREYTSRSRTDEEISQIRVAAETMAKAVPNATVKIDESDRDITAVQCRPGGQTWILSSRGSHSDDARGLGSYDVFDEGGHYVHTLSIDAPCNPKRDQWFVRGDYFYVVEEGTALMRGMMGAMGNLVAGLAADSTDTGEERLPAIVCYRFVD